MRFDSCITLDSMVMGKAKALAICSKYQHTPALQDRLKRYQAISRFNPATDSFSSTAIFGGPSLIIHDPVASILRCEGHLFLCLGEVTNIRVESYAIDQIAVDMLSEKLVSVSFQLLYFVSCSTDDDPTGKYDWQSQQGIQPPEITVPGRLIQTVDPQTTSGISGNASFFYLMQSSVLCSIAAVFLDTLTAEDATSISTIPHSDKFPYREAQTGDSNL